MYLCVGYVFSDAGSLPAVPQHSLYNYSHYHFLYIVLVISTHCVVKHINNNNNNLA